MNTDWAKVLAIIIGLMAFFIFFIVIPSCYIITRMKRNWYQTSPEYISKDYDRKAKLAENSTKNRNGIFNKLVNIFSRNADKVVDTSTSISKTVVPMVVTSAMNDGNSSMPQTANYPYYQSMPQTSVDQYGNPQMPQTANYPYYQSMPQTVNHPYYQSMPQTNVDQYKKVKMPQTAYYSNVSQHGNVKTPLINKSKTIKK